CFVGLNKRPELLVVGGLSVLETRPLQVATEVRDLPLVHLDAKGLGSLAEKGLRVLLAVDAHRARSEPQLLPPHPHDPQAEGMKRQSINVQPNLAEHPSEPCPQLARSSGGKGERQNARRRHLARRDQVRDSS